MINRAPSRAPGASTASSNGRTTNELVRGDVESASAGAAAGCDRGERRVPGAEPLAGVAQFRRPRQGAAADQGRPGQVESLFRRNQQKTAIRERIADPGKPGAVRRY